MTLRCAPVISILWRLDRVVINSETNLVQVSRERRPLIVNDLDQPVVGQTAATIKDYKTAVIKTTNLVLDNLSDTGLQLRRNPCGHQS